MMSISFKDGGLRFLREMEKKNGDDLIYSLALEKGNVFVCIAAHPSMTAKRWDTGNERILFIIDEGEYVMDQDLLIDDLTERVKDHTVYVTDDDIDVLGDKINEGL